LVSSCLTSNDGSILISPCRADAGSGSTRDFNAGGCGVRVLKATGAGVVVVVVKMVSLVTLGS